MNKLSVGTPDRATDYSYTRFKNESIIKDILTAHFTYTIIRLLYVGQYHNYLNYPNGDISE